MLCSGQYHFVFGKGFCKNISDMKNIEIIDNSMTQTPATQTLITPKIAIEMLQKGNERFLQNKLLDRNFDRQVAETAKGQYLMKLF